MFLLPIEMDIWSKFLVNLLLAQFLFYIDRALSPKERSCVLLLFGLEWVARGNCCLIVGKCKEKERKL